MAAEGGWPQRVVNRGAASVAPGCMAAKGDEVWAASVLTTVSPRGDNRLDGPEGGRLGDSFSHHLEDWTAVSPPQAALLKMARNQTWLETKYIPWNPTLDQPRNTMALESRRETRPMRFHDAAFVLLTVQFTVFSTLRSE